MKAAKAIFAVIGLIAIILFVSVAARSDYEIETNVPKEEQRTIAEEMPTLITGGILAAISFGGMLYTEKYGG